MFVLFNGAPKVCSFFKKTKKTHIILCKYCSFSQFNIKSLKISVFLLGNSLKNTNFAPRIVFFSKNYDKYHRISLGLSTFRPNVGK